MKKVGYVVGFLFSPDFKKVILIRKNRPDWQVGLLNGVGGHIEEGETWHQAMVREFKEEMGLSIRVWNHFSKMEFNKSVVHFFWASSHKFDKVVSTTDEQVQIVKVCNILHMPVIPNLKWLIPSIVFDRGWVNSMSVDCVKQKN